MRIAHLIMAHKNPAQLVRLVQKLDHPNFDIFIHIDAKADIKEFELLEDIKNVTFIKKREKCNWGGFSLMNGIINCLAEILQSKIKYGFINFISGQDYPLFSSEYIYNFLIENEGRIFISYEDHNELEWWKEAAGRYERYHLTDYNFKGKYVVEKLINFVTPKRKFPYAMKLYGGNKACWWILNEESAEYVVTKLSTSPKLINFLKLCWGTDEFVIPTLLMNSPFQKNIINNNMRYIDWSEGNAHPRILTIENAPEILDSQMLFARKFDISADTKILDKIDLERDLQLAVN